MKPKGIKQNRKIFDHKFLLYCAQILKLWLSLLIEKCLVKIVAITNFNTLFRSRNFDNKISDELG